MNDFGINSNHLEHEHSTDESTKLFCVWFHLYTRANKVIQHEATLKNQVTSIHESSIQRGVFHCEIMPIFMYACGNVWYF